MRVLVATYKNPNHSIGFGRADMYAILDSVKRAGHELYYHYISRFSVKPSSTVLEYLDGDESKYSSTLMRKELEPDFEQLKALQSVNRKLANKVMRLSAFEYIMDEGAIEDIIRIIREKSIDYVILAGLPYGKFIREACPDVKILHWSFDPVSLTVKSQISEEEFEQAKPLIVEMENFIYGSVDSISVASRNDQKYLKSLGFDSWVRVYSFESEVDARPEIRNYEDVDSKITRFFVVGGKWWRNVPNIKKFVQLLHLDPDYTGFIVTPYVRESWLKKSIQDIESRVDTRSKVKDLASVMNTCHLSFIVQDYESGYCTKLMHSLQTATPAVTTKSALDSIRLPEEYGFDFTPAEESVILVEDENVPIEEVKSIIDQYKLGDLNLLSQKAYEYSSQLTYDRCIEINKKMMFG